MTEAADVVREEAPAKDAALSPAKGVNVGVLALIAIIAVLLSLHLIGDRATPYSDQGRVHANVIGIAPEVGGLLTSVNVRSNQTVRRGDVLFAVDPELYEIAVRKARADISAVERDLAASEAGIRAASAGVEAAQAGLLRSEQDAARSERIHAEDAGAISMRRLEFSRASLIESRAKLEVSLAQLDQARQARGIIGENNDRLIAARSALAKAERDLARTRIVAPSDGIVTDLRAEAGQFAAPGSPVMTFIALHDGWVAVDMTENNLGRMKVGDRADVVLDVNPGTVIAGRVRSIGVGVSTGAKSSPGALPEIQNSRDWLRQSQRFPVIIEFEKGILASQPGVREGGQAEAVVYTGDNPLLNLLGSIRIRLMSWLSYAY
jgi:multidrug resistance efflux pump